MLAERSASWNAKPENRHLPSALEWANIRLLTNRRDWTDPQCKTMKRAGRVHGVRGLTLCTVLILLGWGGYEVNGQFKAQRLRDKLLGSTLADVPDIITELKPNRRWIDPLLRQAYAEAREAGKSQKQLHAGLALMEVDDSQSPYLKDRSLRAFWLRDADRKSPVPMFPYLKDRLLSAEAHDISVIRQLLAGHSRALVDDCWQVLEQPSPQEQGKALQAASALALYAPENPRWEKIRVDVANRLLAENAYVVARWIDALRPAAKQLSDPLTAVFHDEERGESERTLAASALAEYLCDQPGDLAELLITATEKQFAALYPNGERRSERIAPFLERELSRKPPFLPTDVDSKYWDKFYKRKANAAVALIRMQANAAVALRMVERQWSRSDNRQVRFAHAEIVALIRIGRVETSWSLLKHSPDPSLRSYLVNSLARLGVEPGSPFAKLDQQRDVSIRRAFILSLGEYEVGRLSTPEQNAWTKKLIDLYRNDPDPGIHGASEWLLRQWRNENQIQGIDEELRKLPLPTLRTDQGEASSKGNVRGWCVNSQGQTMVVVRGPVEFQMGESQNRHRERIGHSFAIACKEVTVEQFETFLKENVRVDFTFSVNYSPTPTCPMNSVSWCDAAAFCNWLSKREGIPMDEWCYGPNEKGDYAEGMKLMSNPENRKGYRLPTEAEWEYSCRAGASTGYSFGEPWELMEKYGWSAENSRQRTHPVGSLKPNDLGLFDLHGNLWEWCHDSWNVSEPGRNEIVAALTIISLHGSNQSPPLLRGGGFINPPASVRSAERYWSAPANRSTNFGFRLARTYH
jgi:eukaryotic-like serine/threonine-protein kinase